MCSPGNNESVTSMEMDRGAQIEKECVTKEDNGWENHAITFDEFLDRTFDIMDTDAGRTVVGRRLCSW